MIDGHTVLLTPEMADEKAKGWIAGNGGGYSYKLTRKLWERYERAKIDGYVVLPDRREQTRRLKGVWFTWTEASYHPYVFIEKRRGEKWHVEMDNVAFYNSNGFRGKCPLTILNKPKWKQRFIRQCRQLYDEIYDSLSGPKELWVSSGRPYVLAMLDVQGIDQAKQTAQSLLQLGKVALDFAMEAMTHDTTN
jgi:hypothetical protein